MKIMFGTRLAVIRVVDTVDSERPWGLTALNKQGITYIAEDLRNPLYPVTGPFSH